MGHWARAPAKPQHARWPGPWPVRFLWLGLGPGLLALSYVLWPCPMSHGAGLCPLCPMSLSHTPIQLKSESQMQRKSFDILPSPFLSKTRKAAQHTSSWHCNVELLATLNEEQFPLSLFPLLPGNWGPAW